MINSYVIFGVIGEFENSEYDFFSTGFRIHMFVFLLFF